MSFADTALLGALAGFTIYLGLPVGRLELVGPRTRVALAMFSVGVLVFLLVDVLSHGFEIAEDAVSAFEAGDASFGHALALAALLVGGFALHNATEGFGIVGPLGDVKPSWRWLGLTGLIGGAPTFLGAMIGYHVTSEPLELVFYAVAGGAILYVIGEIWHGMRRHGYRELGLLMLAAGFSAGVLTDLVVAYGGG